MAKTSGKIASILNRRNAFLPSIERREEESFTSRLKGSRVRVLSPALAVIDWGNGTQRVVKGLAACGRLQEMAKENGVILL